MTNGPVPLPTEPPLTTAERASLTVLSGVVARIAAVVDAETEALRQHRRIDLASVNQRKRQGLLELSMVMPQLSRRLLAGPAGEQLTQLSAKLDRNRGALEIQLEAVREVADTIAALIRDAESDGTYTAVLRRA